MTENTGAEPTGSDLLVARRGEAVWVTLNRPHRLNALTASLMAQLRALWRELATDTDVRCVVITGAGRGFCSGADIELLASDRSDAAVDVAEELSFLPGRHLDVPVIALVNGACSGGGLHFVADADIAIAARSARFSDPHVTVGAVSALEPASLLLRMRGDVLRRMVLLGAAGSIDAAEAHAAGLVSEVVDDSELVTRAEELVAAICAGSPTAVAISRRLLREAEHDLIDRVLARGWAAIRAHWHHPDAAEGPAAWKARRTPTWAPRTAPTRLLTR